MAQQQVTVGSLPTAVKPLGLIVLVLVAAYWAYAVVFAPEDTLETKAVADTPKTSQVLPDTLDGIKGAAEIQSIAETGNGSAKINKIKLEKKDATLAYSVITSDGRVRYYDAATGAFITEDAAPASDSADIAIPDGFVAHISMEQAKAIAVERVPLESITGIALESSKGQPVYRVYFDGGSRVTVSANDGTVTGIQGHEPVPVSTPPVSGVELPENPPATADKSVSEPPEVIDAEKIVPEPAATVLPVEELDQKAVYSESVEALPTKTELEQSAAVKPDVVQQ